MVLAICCTLFDHSDKHNGPLIARYPILLRSPKNCPCSRNSYLYKVIEGTTGDCSTKFVDTQAMLSAQSMHVPRRIPLEWIPENPDPKYRANFGSTYSSGFRTSLPRLRPTFICFRRCLLTFKSTWSDHASTWGCVRTHHEAWWWLYRKNLHPQSDWHHS